MQPRISIITLGVNNLEKSLAFYRDGLGLQTNGIIGTEFKGDKTHPAGAIVLFELQRGLILSLYPRTELAKDAKEPIRVSSPTEFSIGHLVQNKEEVDSLMKQAESAGATVNGKPQELRRTSRRPLPITFHGITSSLETADLVGFATWQILSNLKLHET